LERIARDSEKDHWPIMEILTAYVRERAVHVPDPHVKPLAKDIQAILMRIVVSGDLPWITLIVM
jgi:hypothetical protein